MKVCTIPIGMEGDYNVQHNPANILLESLTNNVAPLCPKKYDINTILVSIQFRAHV